MPTDRSANSQAAARTRRVRIIFAVLSAALLLTAVCIVIYLVRRDTPSRAVRRTMGRFTDFGHDVPGELDGWDVPSSEDPQVLSALEQFYAGFSFRILSVEKDAETARALVRVTTPDARLLAHDIRLSMLDVTRSGEDTEDEDSRDVFARMDSLLSSGDYESADTEGTVSLSRTQDGWSVDRDSSLTSLLLGGMPEYLSDPFLVTPEEVVSVWLQSYADMSPEEWALTLGASDLFSTYAADPAQIDSAFLSKAHAHYAYSVGDASVEGSLASVEVTITSISTRDILLHYRDRLVSYGQDTGSVKDDPSAMSERSAALLLESISEAETSADFPVTILLENDGRGWNITQSDGLTDALLGGMSEAAEEFGSGE